jgi:hypothetical protein
MHRDRTHLAHLASGYAWMDTNEANSGSAATAATVTSGCHFMGDELAEALHHERQRVAFANWAACFSSAAFNGAMRVA